MDMDIVIDIDMDINMDIDIDTSVSSVIHASKPAQRPFTPHFQRGLYTPHGRYKDHTGSKDFIAYLSAAYNPRGTQTNHR